MIEQIINDKINELENLEGFRPMLSDYSLPNGKTTIFERMKYFEDSIEMFNHCFSTGSLIIPLHVQLNELSEILFEYVESETNLVLMEILLDEIIGFGVDSNDEKDKFFMSIGHKLLSAGFTSFLSDERDLFKLWEFFLRLRQFIKSFDGINRNAILLGWFEKTNFIILKG